MKPQILVVDDSLTVRMDLRRVMATAGFAVTACETHAVATKMLRDKTFSLVILDVVLPDGDGIDILNALRSSADSARVPIIVLTNEAEVRHRIHGLRMGADEYIAKPYDRSYLALRASELAKRPRGAPPAPAGSNSLVGKKLLVVDDSPTYRETLAQTLRREGCNVVLARSGQEALALLEIEQVDCVIVDYMMPGMSGLDVAKHIKCTSTLAQTPVVLLTGLDQDEIQAEATLAGVDKILLKSPELPLLKPRLRTLLLKPPADAEARPAPSSRPSYAMASMPGRAQGLDEAPPFKASGSLFQQVVAASGLSSVIGPSTLQRACKRAGVEPSSMSVADLNRALPAIQETLQLFLSKEDYGRRIAALTVLARDLSAQVRF